MKSASRRYKSLKSLRQWKRLPPISELIGLLFLVLPLFSAFNTIESANWITNLPPLLIPICLSLAVSYYLIHRGSSQRIIHSVAVATGVVAALSFGLGLWGIAGSAHLVMGLSILMIVWWFTHATLWLAFRGPSPVFIVLPGLAALMITLAFLSSEQFFRLPLYLLSTAPAMVYFHLRQLGVRSTITPMLAPLVVGLVLMGFALAFTWPTPSPEDAIRPSLTKQLEEPLYMFWENAAGLLQSIPNKKTWPQVNLHPTLPFTAPLELNDDIIMMVKADKPYKWRVRVFETYTKDGWVRTPEEPRIDFGEMKQPIGIQEVRFRQKTEIEVRILSTNTHMVSAGIPLESSIPSEVEFSPTASFTINLEGDQGSFLPPAVKNLRNSLIINRNMSDLQDMVNSAGFKLTQGLPITEIASPKAIRVERAKDTPNPHTAIMFPHRQSPPKSYTVHGSVSSAPAVELKQAATDYPDWVSDRYMQLPPNYPERLKDLAHELSVGQNNPYSIVTNVQQFLRALPQRASQASPPSGSDPVDWFINVQHAPFSSYYASALVTMVRSLGIPARLVVGFAPGDWDDGRNARVVRAKHYHVWPEVYFPELGWVEFEPTPLNIQPTLEELVSPSGEIPTGLEAELLDECFLLGIDCGDDVVGPIIERFQIADDRDENRNLALYPADVNQEGIPDLVIWLASIAALVIMVTLGIKLSYRYLNARLGAPVVVFYSMNLLATLGGAARRPHDTPTELGARLSSLLPDQINQINNVVTAYQVIRYSRGKRLSYQQSRKLHSSWMTLRWPLISLIFRRAIIRNPFGDRSPFTTSPSSGTRDLV